MRVTVAARTAVVSYAEDGVSTLFAVPYRFKASTDLVVERIQADGTVLTLAIGADYTVSGGETDAGGSIRRAVASSGATLRIRRVTVRAQPMAYPTGGRFPAESHEAALDRLTLIAQEQDDLQSDTADRALLLPAGEVAAELPPAAGRARSALVFDDEGRPLAKPIGSFPAGPPGGDSNSYPDLASLKAAQVTGLTYQLRTSAGPRLYAFVVGDFTGKADDLNYVKLDAVDLSVGVLKLQGASTVGYRAVPATAIDRDVFGKLDERRSLFDFIPVTYHDAIKGGSSGIDLTSYVVAALADAQTRGRGVFVPDGIYTMGDVVLPASVTVASAAAGVAFTFGGRGANFKAKAGSSWIMTTPDGGGGCGISGINFLGLGAGSGGGLKVGQNYWGAYSNMTFDGFGQQAILVTGINADFRQMLIINSLMTRNRSGYAGALEVAGTDNNFYNIEATTSQARGDPDTAEGSAFNSAAIVNSQLFNAAIYVRNSALHNFFCNNVAELSECGFRSETETTQVVNLRCDLNLGHGGIGAIFGAGVKTLNNSQGGDNLYSGWYYEPGQAGGMVSPYRAISTTNKRHKYGLDLSQGGGSGVDQRADWFVRSTGHRVAAAANFFQPNTIRYAGAQLRDQTVTETPDVDQVRYILPRGDQPTVIVTTFIRGVTGQRISLGGNAAITVKNGSGILTNTGADKVLAAGRLYNFTLLEVPGGAAWVEDA